MVEKTSLPNGDSEWKTSRGVARVARPVEGVILVTVTGHSSMDFYPLYTGEAEKLLSRGRSLDWFADYAEMTSYDSDIRLALSEFTNKYKAQLTTVGVLVKSRIVSMGVTVASLATGGKVSSFSDRAKFQASVDAAIARHRSGASVAAR